MHVEVLVFHFETGGTYTWTHINCPRTSPKTSSIIQGTCLSYYTYGCFHPTLCAIPSPPSTHLYFKLDSLFSFFFVPGCSASPRCKTLLLFLLFRPHVLCASPSLTLYSTTSVSSLTLFLFYSRVLVISFVPRLCN